MDLLVKRTADTGHHAAAAMDEGRIAFALDAEG
jgi:hypothetical protein